MSTDADRTIDALQSGHDDLAGLVRTLTPVQLTGPSGASEWDVSQVLSHLGSGAVITKAGLDGALSGTGNPAPDFNQGVWARWNAMTPQERADGFLAADAELLAAYHRMDGQVRESLRTDLGFLPEPVDLATAAGFRLNEFALHSWDVRVAFDPAATIRPEAVPLLVDRVAFLLGWVAKPAALDGRSGTLLVRLSDPEQEFGLRLGEGVGIVPAPAQPDGVLTAPAEAWLRLATGRLSAEHTPSQVEITGDIDLATLRRVFPGF
jgi:uncharacterized protein (TIGR03083 family)